MPQLTYTTQPARALDGTFADTGSRYAATHIAAAVVPPGRFVVRDSDGGSTGAKVRLPATTGEVANAGVGFAVLDLLREPNTGFAIGDVLSVAKRGVMNVLCVGAVTEGASVFVIHTGANAGRVAATALTVSSVDTATITPYTFQGDFADDTICKVFLG